MMGATASAESLPSLPIIRLLKKKMQLMMPKEAANMVLRICVTKSRINVESYSLTFTVYVKQVKTRSGMSLPLLSFRTSAAALL